MTTADLLEKWREATRAAELAKRLAELAVEAAERAGLTAAASEEIAELAERTAAAATQAAATARRAADEASRFAAERGGSRLHTAEQVVEATTLAEDEARSAYHDGEREARDRRD